MRVVRILAAVLLIGLLFWLWYDARPQRKIARAIAKGQIGGLSATEMQAFREAMSWLAAAIDGATITVNEPGAKSTVRVLTIADTGSETFHCGPGNALYDSGLDAVLIHADLVRAWLTPEFGTSEVFSPRKLFLVFLLLHEIGHKVKHGATRGTYGALALGGDRRLEEEADTYGFDAMQRLARTPLTVSSGERAMLAKAWKLPPGSYRLAGWDLVTDVPKPGQALGTYPPLPEEARQEASQLQKQPEEVRTDLLFLSWMHALPRAAMRADTPYSSLHEDRGHPTLVRRLNTLLQRYRLQSTALSYRAGPDGLWAGRTDALAAIEEQTELLNRMSSQPLLEITLPSAVAALTWTDAKLLILTDDGNLYSVAREQMTHPSGPSPLAKLLLTTGAATVRPQRPDQWATIQAELWTDNRGRAFIYADDGIYEQSDRVWRRLSQGPLAAVSILSVTRSASAAHWVIWTGDLLKITDPHTRSPPVANELIVVEDGSMAGARRSIEALMDDVRARTGLSEATIDVAAANDTAVWLSVWDRDDHLLGLTAFDPKNLAFMRFVRVERAGVPILKDSSKVALVTKGLSGGAIVTSIREPEVKPAAGRQLDPLEVDSFDLDGKLRKRAALNVPFSRVVQLLPDLPESVVDGAEFLDDNHLLINFHSWSPSFLVDLRDGTSRPLYFPSTSISATSPSGLIAFVPLSGGEASLGNESGANYRCYVVDPGIR